jgi:ribonuclease P protein component
VGGNLATLKQRSDFLRVAGAGRKAVTPGLILQAAARRPSQTPPAGSLAPMRVGYTASRRVGGAVVRNRAKRRLRAAAARVLPRRGSAATDYVLIARAATPGRPFAALVADLEAALRRIERGPAVGARTAEEE